jgi:hypothetical protein
MTQHWLTRPRTIRRLWIVFAAILACTVGAQFLVAGEAHFAIERLFGFNALYGFLACAAMILFAKLLGLALKRPDTYYDEERRDG